MRWRPFWNYVLYVLLLKQPGDQYLFLAIVEGQGRFVTLLLIIDQGLTCRTDSQIIRSDLSPP